MTGINIESLKNNTSSDDQLNSYSSPNLNKVEENVKRQNKNNNFKENLKSKEVPTSMHLNF